MHGTMEMLNLGFHCVLAILCQRLICGIVCRQLADEPVPVLRKWGFALITGPVSLVTWTLIAIPVYLLVAVVCASWILQIDRTSQGCFIGWILVGNLIAIAFYVLMGIGDLTFSWFCM